MAEKFMRTLVALVLATAGVAMAKEAPPTPLPNQLITYTNVQSAVDAHLLQWKDCKAMPGSNRAISFADYKATVAHVAIPGSFPDNQMITYAQALKYRDLTQKCNDKH